MIPGFTGDIIVGHQFADQASDLFGRAFAMQRDSVLEAILFHLRRHRGVERCANDARRAAFRDGRRERRSGTSPPPSATTENKLLGIKMSKSSGTRERRLDCRSARAEIQ